MLTQSIYTCACCAVLPGHGFDQGPSLVEGEAGQGNASMARILL